MVTILKKDNLYHPHYLFTQGCNFLCMVNIFTRIGDIDTTLWPLLCHPLNAQNASDVNKVVEFGDNT
jgi:hypothetical protein